MVLVQLAKNDPEDIVAVIECDVIPRIGETIRLEITGPSGVTASLYKVQNVIHDSYDEETPKIMVMVEGLLA